MFFKRGPLAAALALCLAGCARQSAPPSAQRIALARFENLGQDESADWIGRAIPLVLETGLGELPNVSVIGTAQLHVFDRSLGVRPISAPGISSERMQALAAGANRIAYGDYDERGGRLYVRFWLEDPQRQRIVKTIAVSAASGDAIGAARELERQLGARPAPYFTRSEACLRAYAQGLESKDPAQAAARMEEAIAADADFGPAYRSLAEIDAQRQDREAAKGILGRALARPGIVPIERARAQLDLAALDGDTAAKEQALASLTKLEPGNPAVWQSFAEAAMARHDYAAAVDGYRHALAFAPENTTLLNQLGYAAAYDGKLDEGMAALRRYRALRPRDANALDSMGDLNLISNRYHEAEDYYQQACKTDPNFNANCDLFKAAMARAMTGDLAGAEDLYKQYVAARTLAHDATAPFRYPEWLWLTGRRKQAMAGLLAYARTAETRGDHPAAAHAYAALAIWDLMENGRAAAAEMAQKADPHAGASPAAVVVIARFLAQPSAPPAEWQARAGRFVPNQAQTALRDQVLAWALLLDGQFAAAQAPLERLYGVTGNASNEGVAVLLAWCSVETGNFKAAAPLLAFTPVPPASGIATFTPLWFPRLFLLRAQMAEKSGNAAEAKRNRDLLGKFAAQ